MIVCEVVRPLLKEVVTRSTQATLEALITLKELSRALDALPRDNFTGSDNVGLSFYTKYWLLVGPFFNQYLVLDKLIDIEYADDTNLYLELH